MQSEYIFSLTPPDINIAQVAGVTEKQIVAGGFLQGHRFSYQGLPANALWLNLVITTNPKAETSLCFFMPSDESESNCCRLIHAVDIDFFESLERKIESPALRFKSSCLTIGEVKNFKSIGANEIKRQVEHGLLIACGDSLLPARESIEEDIKSIGVGLGAGDAIPLHMEVNLLQVNYQFSSKVDGNPFIE
jgi:hypothetical protein